MKFLLSKRSGIEIIETESLDDALFQVTHMKYPADFVSLTIMEYIDGPY